MKLPLGDPFKYKIVVPSLKNNYLLSILAAPSLKTLILPPTKAVLYLDTFRADHNPNTEQTIKKSPSVFRVTVSGEKMGLKRRKWVLSSGKLYTQLVTVNDKAAPTRNSELMTTVADLGHKQSSDSFE